MRTSLVRTASRAGQVIGLHFWRLHPFSSESSPIVIGGCGRSGTTLLRVMLDTHPRLCIGPESSLFRPLWPSYRRLGQGFGLEEERIRYLARQSSSQAQFIELFFDEYCRNREKPRWGEKTPRNIRHLDFIIKHFPRARFIHVIRDGRDLVCSLRTHPRYDVVDGTLRALNRTNPIARCIQRWIKDVRTGLRYRGNAWYSEVKYEDIVIRPDETLRRICDFAEEQYDERMLSYHKVEGRSRDPVNFPQGWEATTPLSDCSIGRWRADLTTDERLLFKRLAGRLLIELGYVSNDAW